MRTDSPDVFVLGAGVAGLSTALVLLEAGLSVTVYAAEPPQRTTSAVAGALWGAHLVGADDRVGRWAAVTLRRFRDLTKAVSSTSASRCAASPMPRNAPPRRSS